MTYLDDVISEALTEIRDKSKSRIYQRDPEAWVSDILGKRWWGMQREIAWSYIENPRTAVKSANGTGKSWLVADLIPHFVCTQGDPGEALALVTAPTLGQVADVVFAYLKANYSLALHRDMRLPGAINENLEWNYKGASGNQLMVKGLKPSDSDAVSSFQGRRRKRTAVFLDEAGGVSPDIFTAMEAVTTGEGSRLVAIGNPDRTGTEFWRLYNDSQYASEWKTFTISAFDLPTFTGEVVFPEDEDRQHQLLTSGMTTPSWVENKRKVWGEGSARWQAKVLGEFPDVGDNSFFPMPTIEKAFNTEVPDVGEAPVVLGVDVARMGQDETVVYECRDGRIRFVDSWGKSDNVDNASRIDQHARKLGAAEVRIDAAGTGSGTFDILNRQDGKAYLLFGVLGANASPDKNKWAQARSYHYDSFREGMMSGAIDLDENDARLKDELISQTYRFSNRNALQITPKDEMKKAGLGSPDYLDAAIYAYIDMTPFGGNVANKFDPGTRLYLDPWRMLEASREDAGYPV